MHRRILSIALLVAISTVALADAQGHGLSAEARSDFAWFDTLNYPDLGALDAVVTENSATDAPAFLMSRDRRTIVTADLARHEFVADPLDCANCPVGVRIITGEEFWRRVRELDNWIPSRPWPLAALGTGMPFNARAFVVARYLAAVGLEDEAQSVYEYASQGHPRSYPSEPTTLRDRFRHELVSAEMWRALLRTADPQTSYASAREGFSALREQFPESRLDARLEEAVTMLDRLEDEESRRPNLDLLEHGHLADRIEGLVFALRDHTRTFYLLGTSLVVDTLDDAPAAQLLALDVDAVPALLAALDDLTFTRAISCYRDHFFSHDLYRVSDVAYAILQEIADGGIAPHFTPDMSATRIRTERRQAAETWWKTTRTASSEHVTRRRTQWARDRPGLR